MPVTTPIARAESCVCPGFDLGSGIPSMNQNPDAVADVAADRLTLQAGHMELATASVIEVVRTVETPGPTASRSCSPGTDVDGSNWTRACRTLKLPQWS